MDAKRARELHESRLMRLANVTGVGTGRDEHSGVDVIVVFVTRKVPREGVPVRVLAVGEVGAHDQEL